MEKIQEWPAEQQEKLEADVLDILEQAAKDPELYPEGKVSWSNLVAALRNTGHCHFGAFHLSRPGGWYMGLDRQRDLEDWLVERGFQMSRICQGQRYGRKYTRKGTFISL